MVILVHELGLEHCVLEVLRNVLLEGQVQVPNVFGTAVTAGEGIGKWLDWLSFTSSNHQNDRQNMREIQEQRVKTASIGNENLPKFLYFIRISYVIVGTEWGKVG